MAVERPTRWLELSVEADAESVEAVSDLLARYGHNQGVVVEEPYRQDHDGENFAIDPTRPVVVRTFLPEDDDAEPAREAVERGLWHLRQIGPVGELQTRVVVEEDWANAWKEHFHVRRFGRRFIVKPSWQAYEPAPDDLVIHLDPGMAFGTGAHPSTELVLTLMEEVDFNGARVLDAGAGSGILSIGAALLGAAQVDAVEIDPYAVKTMVANLELNGQSDCVAAITGPVGSVIPVGARYDVVLANLIARILIEDARALTAQLRPGGVLIASGVIFDREAEVVAAFRALGCTLTLRAQGGDWVTLRFERT
jgi:ribosomal protein L11 methyltransferase